MNMKPELYFDGDRKIAYYHLPESRSFSIVVSVRDGVGFEEKDEWGAGHFLEHLHFQGCHSYPSFNDLVWAVEERGGKFSAQTTRQAVIFWIKVPEQHADFAFSLLGEIMDTVEFSEDAARKETKIIHEENAREKSQPNIFNQVALENHLLSPLPLCRHPLGPCDGVNFSARFVSEYKKKHYTGQNFAFAISGNKDFNYIKKMVDNCFPKKSGKTRQINNDNFTLANADEKIHYINYPLNTQANLGLGFLIPETEKSDYAKVYFLNTLLGTGFGSLLYQKFRMENPYAYLPTTSLRTYPGLYTLRIGLQVSIENLCLSLSLLFSILKDISSGKIKEEDLKRTKGLLKGLILFRTEDTLEMSQMLISRLIAEVEPVKPEVLIEQIENITTPDISYIAEHFISFNKMKISFLGDETKIREELGKCKDLLSITSG